MVWEKLFNQRVLQRGKEYADNGKVSNIQYKPGELCATINGRERYDVKISFDKSKNITRMHCTCPSAAEIYYCKHCAAVLYKAEEFLTKDNDITDDTLVNTANTEEIFTPLKDIQPQKREKYPVRQYYPKNKTPVENIAKNVLRLAGIDEKEARKKVFLTQDAKKVLTPIPANYTSVCGKQELTITYQIANRLNVIWEELQNAQCYPAETGVSYILSGEEVADREDPNRGTDAFMHTNPELDTDKVAALTTEDCLDRYAWFVAIANKIAEADVLNFILKKAPKKKDGTFDLHKTTVIAALPIVFTREMRYYEIVGKAKTDKKLIITIRKCRFSEAEWVLTRDNDFLRYIETGDPDSAITNIKIYHKKGRNKRTIEIPAIRLENGELAINAKPYRPISDFSCVIGNDQEGYEILEPVAPPFISVCHNNIETALQWMLSTSYIGIDAIWSSLEEVSEYILTRNRSYLMRTQIFTGTRAGEEIPERCLNENYTAEIAYQLLCVLENINILLAKTTLPEEIGAILPRNADGTLRTSGKVDIKVTGAPCRTVPLIYGSLHMMNENTQKTRVMYELGHESGNRWSEFEEANL